MLFLIYAVAHNTRARATTAILIAMPLNCRDRRKRTPWRKRVGPPKYARITEDDDVAPGRGTRRRCVSRERLIINSSGFCVVFFSFFFYYYYYYFCILPPFPPSSTATTTATPQLICTSRRLIGKEAMRSCFPYRESVIFTVTR